MATARDSTDDSAPAASARGAFRAGRVAILGRPNVGKSTLLNRLLGQKVAIVTPKPQTTRNRILGVWDGTVADTGGGRLEGQIAFLDTPGVHEGGNALGRFMQREALDSIDLADAALLVVEAPDAGPARAGAGVPERRILERLAHTRAPCVLAINKVDRQKDKSQILPAIAAWNEVREFHAIVPISATRGDGVDALLAELVRLMPAGTRLHAQDAVTDRSERFLAGELVREALFLRLRQEVPYALAVEVEDWQERPERGDVVVTATIVVEREGQKAIVIGRGGAMIREVGTAARAAISEMLRRPAHVLLNVKVLADWTASSGALARLGYRADP